MKRKNKAKCAAAASLLMATVSTASVPQNQHWRPMPSLFQWRAGAQFPRRQPPPPPPRQQQQNGNKEKDARALRRVPPPPHVPPLHGPIRSALATTSKARVKSTVVLPRPPPPPPIIDPMRHSQTRNDEPIGKSSAGPPPLHPGVRSAVGRQQQQTEEESNLRSVEVDSHVRSSCAGPPESGYSPAAAAQMKDERSEHQRPKAIPRESKVLNNVEPTRPTERASTPEESNVLSAKIARPPELDDRFSEPADRTRVEQHECPEQQPKVIPRQGFGGEGERTQRADIPIQDHPRLDPDPVAHTRVEQHESPEQQRKAIPIRENQVFDEGEPKLPTRRANISMQGHPPTLVTEKHVEIWNEVMKNAAVAHSRSPPRRVWNTPNGDTIYSLAPPEQAIGVLSLETGLTARRKRERDMRRHQERDILESLVLADNHRSAVLDHLLSSQESIQKELFVIESLLQQALAAQREERSLVVHVPRHVVAQRQKKKLLKVRKIPRRTFLSSHAALDRDLTDGEFEAILYDLQQPSEVEEEYSVYEYDEAYEYDHAPNMLAAAHPFSPNEEDTIALLGTNNLMDDDDAEEEEEEVNAFLRETNVPESWQTVEESQEDEEYDTDLFYDEYYEAFKDEEHERIAGLRKASQTDTDFHSEADDDFNEAVREEASGRQNLESPHSEHTTVGQFQDALEDEKLPAMTVPTTASSAKTNAHVPPPPPTVPPMDPLTGQVHLFPEKGDDRYYNESLSAMEPPLQSGQMPQSPIELPPRSERKPVRSVAPPIRVHNAQGTTQELKQPPPPPRPPAPKVLPHETPTVGIEPDALQTELSSDGDESDVLDEEELLLLKETIVGDTSSGGVDDTDDYDDWIDEEDLRILQFSRWLPFSGKKKLDVDDLLDDDFSDDGLDGDITSDDFTDIENAPILVPAASLSTSEDLESSSSSEEEMMLGESAVTDILENTVNHFGALEAEPPRHVVHGEAGLLTPPLPPPRPPPRPQQHELGLTGPPQPEGHATHVTRYATHYHVYTREYSHSRDPSFYDDGFGHEHMDSSSHTYGGPGNK